MTVMAMAALCAVIAAPAYAAYEDSLKGYWKMDDLSYDDNFTGTLLNANLWSLSTDSHYSFSQNNQASFSYDTYYSGSGWSGSCLYGDGKLELKGDFDIRVKYGITSNNGVAGGLEFGVADNDGDGVYIRRGYNGIYDSDYYINNTWNHYVSTGSTSDTTAQLRIARTGTTISLYSGDLSNNWTLRRTITDDEYNSEMSVILYLNTHGGSTPKSGYYDDFTVVNGETVADAKGTNTGTIYGATQTTGKFGNALSFSEANKSYVTTPGSSDLNFGTGNFSISFWMKQSGNNGNSNGILSSNIDGDPYWTSESNSYLIYFNDASSIAVGNTSSWPLCIIDSLGDEAWHEITYVRSGNMLYGYRDGQLASSSDVTGMSFNSSGSFGLGKQDARDSHYFNGLLDDIGVWNRALDDNEISMTYDLGTEKFEWLTLGINDADELNLGYTTSELKLLAELYANGDAGASETIDDLTWHYLSGDLPGDIGGTTYDYGDTWTYDGKSYIKLGSGLEGAGSAIPEPATMAGFAIAGIVLAMRRSRFRSLRS